MHPDRLAARIEKLREQIAENPEFGEVLNALWWQAVAEQIALLQPDARGQAEGHYEALGMLLSDDDTDDDEEGES
jgi:hypothetical protein